MWQNWKGKLVLCKLSELQVFNSFQQFQVEYLFREKKTALFWHKTVENSVDNVEYIENR